MVSLILQGFCIYTILTTVSLLADGGYHQQQHNSIVTTQAPAGNDSCQSALLALMDCINYLSKTGGITTPGPKCCHGFETVLKNDEPCICVTMKQAPSMGLDIDLKKAGALPSLCGIANAPPISKCNLTSAPVPASAPFAPTEAPPPPPPTKSATPPTTSSPAATTTSVPPPGPAEVPASRAREPSNVAMFIIPISLLFLTLLIHSTILN